jgi:YfiR/HmsC-like
MSGLPSRRRGGRSQPLRIWALLAVLLAPLLALPVWAQLHDEAAVRAAFVFNLTKYVEWPHPGNELVIGFVGDARMGEILQKVLSGKTSESRAIRVVLYPSAEELEQCNIVYIGYSAPEKVRPILEKLRNKNILSVGEDDRFASRGGMVGLVRAADQIHIQINLEAAQKSGLKISSRLLNLAAIVRTSGGGG